jgi:hypothetical protein
MPEVHLLGSVLTGEFFGAPEAFARYRLFAGEGWTPLDSVGHAQTHTASSDPVTDVVTWSHPIEMHYVTTTLREWPRIAVAVWSVDSFGRNEIAGYGVAFIPSTPGIHVFDVACWRPAGNIVQELGGRAANSDVAFSVPFTQCCRVSTCSMVSGRRPSAHRYERIAGAVAKTSPLYRHHRHRSGGNRLCKAVVPALC